MKIQRETTVVKKYVQGYEAKIVELLNLCFGQWGDLERWQYKYPQYPTFDNKDVVIVEHEGEIVGHSGIHVRDLIITNECKVLAALLGDAVVHRDYSGKGIYSKMIKLRLESAKSRGVSLAFTWVLRDSIAYKACKKRGFIEVRQPLLYMKMLRPEKILINRLSLLCRSHKLMNAFHQFKMDIYFSLGNEEVHLNELLNETVKKEGFIRIILSEKALPSMIHFQRISRLRRTTTLLFLLLSRRVKVKSSSMSTFLKFILNGIKVLKGL